MFDRFQFLFSSVFDSKPTPPVPFGFKNGWIAVRSTDTKAVAESLSTRSQRPANWRDGIDAAYRGGDSIFIGPPVSGWVCVVGEWSAGTGNRRSVESIMKTVADLSSPFGEAHGYASHRVIEYHHWIRAEKGRVLRCFAYHDRIGASISPRS